MGALGTLGIAIALVVDFESGTAGLQHVVDESWIPDLGVRYQLGVDGISLFLIVLTAISWAGAIGFSLSRQNERERNYYFLLGLAETATLGAFLAQDLLLFVLFFDLMLIPFFFLIGSFGTGDRVAATLKMIVYTLVGSLLMLVGAIATAILSAEATGELTFSIAELRANVLPGGQPGLDLLLLRGGLPGEDARVPDPRLDARRLQGGAAAGAGAAVRGALEGRRLRLPAGRAADLPRRHHPVPGADPGDRPGEHPLRLGDGVHADERAADRRILVDRPAGLHHRWASSRSPATRPTARSCRWSTTGSWWFRSSW